MGGAWLPAAAPPPPLAADAPTARSRPCVQEEEPVASRRGRRSAQGTYSRSPAGKAGSHTTGRRHGLGEAQLGRARFLQALYPFPICIPHPSCMAGHLGWPHFIIGQQSCTCLLWCPAVAPATCCLLHRIRRCTPATVPLAVLLLCCRQPL